jgi:hypothetical protein
MFYIKEKKSIWWVFFLLYKVFCLACESGFFQSFLWCWDGSVGKIELLRLYCVFFIFIIHMIHFSFREYFHVLLLFVRVVLNRRNLPNNEEELSLEDDGIFTGMVNN